MTIRSFFADLFARPTIVVIRSRRDRVAHRRARVFYDDWGAPYVKFDVFKDGPVCHEQMIYPGGKTSDNIYRTEWRHIAGPPVVWPDSRDRHQLENLR